MIMKKIFAAIAVLAVVAMAAPAMAAADAPGFGVTFGGRIKADMGWQFLNEDVDSANKSGSSIANFFATLNSNTYLRTMFTSADKATGAFIELGMGGYVNNVNDGSAAGNDTVYLRSAYGWWKVGSCKLLVGQFAGRLGDRYIAGQALGSSKSGHVDLNGFGFIGGTRNPKVALQMDINDNFGFEVAMGQSGAEVNTLPQAAFGSGWTGSTNSYIPRFEVVFDFKFGGFMITPGAGISYQQFKWNNPTGAANEPDDNTLSYLLWLPVKYENGPFYVMLNAHFAQNMDTDWTGEQTGAWGTTNAYGLMRHYGGQPLALPTMKADGSVEDTTSWGVGATAGYSFTDQLTLKIGGGYVNLKNDAWERTVAGNTCDNNYGRWAAFIALPYKATSYFTIQPEIGYYNYGDKVAYNYNGRDDAGDEWVIGVHFQFLF